MGQLLIDQVGHSVQAHNPDQNFYLFSVNFDLIGPDQFLCQTNISVKVLLGCVSIQIRVLLLKIQVCDKLIIVYNFVDYRFGV